MNDRQRSLRIDAFPAGRSLWRVDWFGPIAFPDRLVRRRQPSVLVHLSQVLAPNVFESPEVLLLPNSTTDPAHQKKRWVSIGMLMLLRIGDLWQDQAWWSSPGYETLTVCDCQIDEHTTQIVKAGFSHTDGTFLLPLSEHPWHLGNTHSYCIKVDLPNDRYLVIPCMELIRFYFGSSSELLSRLFSPPLERTSLVDHSEYHIGDRTLKIQLADRLPWRSAGDIGRILKSEEAWYAAQLIGTSCLRSSIQREDIYPQADFPFTGKTTLTVHGKWLSASDIPNKTFLAYRIESCSHPFPFRRLYYRESVRTSALQAAKRKVRNGNDGAVGTSRKLHHQEETESARLVERDAGHGLQEHCFVFDAQRGFPDLTRKLMARDRDPAEIAQSTGQAHGSATSCPQVALGEPGSAARVRPITLMDGQPSPPAFVQELLQALDDYELCWCGVLTQSGSDGWTWEAAPVTDEDGVIDDELLIDENGTLRLKRVVVIHVGNGSDDFCVIAFEGNPPTLQFNPVEELEQTEPLILLHKASIDLIAYEEAARIAGPCVKKQAVEVQLRQRLAHLSSVSQAD